MPEKVLLILAAGNSSRLGSPKQMLPMSEKETLLQHTLKAGIDSQVDQVVVVLGAQAQLFEKQIETLKRDKQVRKVANPHWSRGMGSSIKVGLNYILQHNTDLSGVLIAVCDQPHLRAEILNRLIQEGRNRDTAIASQYSPDQYGTPVWFPFSWIRLLLDLPDDRGALFILKQKESEIFSLPFPEGEIDIDTEGDWMRYLASRNNS